MTRRKNTRPVPRASTPRRSDCHVMLSEEIACNSPGMSLLKVHIWFEGILEATRERVDLDSAGQKARPTSTRFRGVQICQTPAPAVLSFSRRIPLSERMEGWAPQDGPRPPGVHRSVQCGRQQSPNQRCQCILVLPLGCPSTVSISQCLLRARPPHSERDHALHGCLAPPRQESAQCMNHATHVALRSTPGPPRAKLHFRHLQHAITFLLFAMHSKATDQDRVIETTLVSDIREKHLKFDLGGTQASV